MKALLLAGVLVFTSGHLAWAAATQVMQQQKQIQEAIVQKAIVERQIAEQMAQQAAQQMSQQAAQQMVEDVVSHGFVIDTEIPVSATITQTVPAAEESVVEMNDILKSLETSSKAWSMIIDREPKTFIVLKYIDYFKSQKILIKKSADYYVDLIDGMATQDPAMLQNPFKNILQLVAILEYDFDNGQDKDKMVIGVLGKEGYLQNKKRLGL